MPVTGLELALAGVATVGGWPPVGLAIWNWPSQVPQPIPLGAYSLPPQKVFPVEGSRLAGVRSAHSSAAASCCYHNPDTAQLGLRHAPSIGPRKRPNTATQA